jgi:hypothetical protein
MAYSKEEIESIFNEIIKQISEGKSLRAVLRQSDMPDSKTFYKWIDDEKDKSLQYVRACNERSDGIFDDLLTIADATEDDIIMSEDGKVVTNHNVIQRDRLRVDARKWALSKMNPKKYGDKVDVTSGGEKINNSNPYLTPDQKKMLDDELNSDY